MDVSRAATECGFELITYCFMPDHLHLLIGGVVEDACMKRFARIAKQYSGYRFKQRTDRRLWQPSYYDPVLRDEDDTWSIARYIVENPLRAKLAVSADQYPHLGSGIVSKHELLVFVSCVPEWSRRMAVRQT